MGVGDHVQVARDGGEAVAYLEGEGAYHDRALYPLPSLMLLDLKLPKKSGLEILEWVRSDPRYKELRVIILTSSREPRDIQRAHELGVVAYHVKPADFHEFAALVESIGHSWIALTKQKKIPDERG